MQLALPIMTEIFLETNLFWSKKVKGTKSAVMGFCTPVSAGFL